MSTHPHFHPVTKRGSHHSYADVGILRHTVPGGSLVLAVAATVPELKLQLKAVGSRYGSPSHVMAYRGKYINVALFHHSFLFSQPTSVIVFESVRLLLFPTRHNLISQHTHHSSIWAAAEPAPTPSATALAAAATATSS